MDGLVLDECSPFCEWGAGMKERRSVWMLNVG